MLSNVLVQDCKYVYICMHSDFINYKSKLDVMTGIVHEERSRKDDNEEFNFPLHVFIYLGISCVLSTYIMLEHTASPLLFVPVIILLCLYIVSMPITIRRRTSGG